MVKKYVTVMEVPNVRLRKITKEKEEKSSMAIKKYLDTPYDSFGKGPQISVYMKSNISVDLNSTEFWTLCLDIYRAYGLLVKVDVQSRIKYPDS
jgi:hypothetical protein